MTCNCERDVYCACLSGTCRCIPGLCGCSAQEEAIAARSALAAEPISPTPVYRQFICKCGCDWVTALPDVDTCQVCYHLGQPDISNWIAP